MSHQTKYQQLAKDILSLCGGSENISSHTHCMTRLRITPIDNEQVHITKIKELDGVIGVVEAETLQIILGTGVVNQVSSAFEQLLNASGSYDLNNEAQKTSKPFHKRTAHRSSCSYDGLPASLFLSFRHSLHQVLLQGLRKQSCKQAGSMKSLNQRSF